MSKEKNFRNLIAEHKTTKITDLPTDMQVVLGFLTLIVDIQYRNKYGCMIDDPNDNSYDKGVKPVL